MVAEEPRGDPAAMRWILVLAFAVAACGQTGPRWLGENIHAVDGYWVGTETLCPAGAAADCAVEVQTAIRTLPAPDRQLVVRAALGGFPSGYVDASGKTILMTFAGLSQPRIVVLDLADGRRRAIPVVCTGPIVTSGGALVGQETCFPTGLPHLRVGREPGFGP
jgi:hypothetical protein